MIFGQTVARLAGDGTWRPDTADQRRGDFHPGSFA
jgi:hypothetical protein